MQQIQVFWTGILDTLSKLVIPDWGSLIALLPVFILVGILLWLAMTVRAYAVLGPRERGRRYIAVPPAGLHAPGPSYAPVLGALGSALLVAGLVVGGAFLLIALGILIVSLLYWGREFMHEYDHLAGASTLPVPMDHGGPPPGVHMPGPSFLPFGSALGAALLFVGVVVGGWVLIGGVVCVIVGIFGWLHAARAEWRNTEEADITGHMRNEPDPVFPLRMFVFFTIVMIAAFSIEGGFIPPRGSTASAGAPGASPGSSASAGPGASGAPGVSPSAIPPSSAAPAADVTLTASGQQFTSPDISGPAGRAFTLAFDNEDPAIPHNVNIRKPDGSEAFKGEIFPGVATKIYQVPALPAGSYAFVCDVHPSMTGTLTVK
jgi:plastocyanin